VDWDDQVELGRALADAPRLGRADASKRGPEDPKWALGDLAATIPEEHLDRFAKEIGVSPSDVRAYRRVAVAWPSENRVAASWTAHRELKDHEERFALIAPGMSMRAAAQAAGKAPIDGGPALHRLSDDELAEYAISILKQKPINDLVTQKLRERKAARRLSAATRAAEDDRSAEYKQAYRDYRQAQSSKSPELAVLDAIFKLRELSEFVRILPEWDAAGGLPGHRRDDVISAISAAHDATAEALDQMRDTAPTNYKFSGGIIDVGEASPRPQLLESD
jgi:hypothetical protein